jgi:hypothetical protein
MLQQVTSTKGYGKMNDQTQINKTLRVIYSIRYINYQDVLFFLSWPM